MINFNKNYFLVFHFYLVIHEDFYANYYEKIFLKFKLI